MSQYVHIPPWEGQTKTFSFISDFWKPDWCLLKISPGQFLVVLTKLSCLWNLIGGTVLPKVVPVTHSEECSMQNAPDVTPMRNIWKLVRCKLRDWCGLNRNFSAHLWDCGLSPCGNTPPCAGTKCEDQTWEQRHAKDLDICRRVYKALRSSGRTS